MVALKLVRLIEKHSEELVRGLAEHIRTSERMSDFRNIPPADLDLAAAEVYCHLGEWLLQKTEKDMERRIGAIAARRVAEQVSLHQFVCALIVSRDFLWRFLQREAFACNVVDLYGELELHQMLTQVFDRAVYYGILAYDKAEQQNGGRNILSGNAPLRQARRNRARTSAEGSRTVR